MKQIAVVCSFGLSTSLLTQAMERSAAEAGLALHIQALGASELAEQADEADVFLLAPQVRYMKQTVVKYNKPVAVIDGFAFAMADGAKVLQQALQLLQDGELR